MAWFISDVTHVQKYILHASSVHLTITVLESARWPFLFMQPVLQIDLMAPQETKRVAKFTGK